MFFSFSKSSNIQNLYLTTFENDCVEGYPIILLLLLFFSDIIIIILSRAIEKVHNLTDYKKVIDRAMPPTQKRSEVLDGYIIKERDHLVSFAIVRKWKEEIKAKGQITCPNKVFKVISVCVGNSTEFYCNLTVFSKKHSSFLLYRNRTMSQSCKSDSFFQLLLGRVTPYHQ